jgi:hypothetical protein
MKGDYEGFYAFVLRKNKPNQTQYYLAPRFTLGVVEKPI